MSRRSSCPFRLFSIAISLWLVSVATEMSFQRAIGKMLSEEQAKFQKDEVTSIPNLRVVASVQKNSKQIQAVRRQNMLQLRQQDGHSFICDTAPKTAKRHKPIVMISNSRTGSNLLFSFFRRLAYLHEKVDALLLYEVFADEKDLQAEKVCNIIDQISRSCGWNSKNVYSEQKFSTPEEVFATARAEFNETAAQQQILHDLQQVFDERYQNPAGLMNFIHRIPSLLPHAFFIFKVFPYHVFEQMNSTVAEFASIFSDMEPEFVMLWRRNILEIFVSLRIAASKKNGWTLQGTTKDDAVVIDRYQLDWYVQHVANFFTQARDYFRSNSIPFDEFEYNRDIVSESGHREIVRRIQTEILHQNPNEDIVQALFAAPTLAKQATVPVSEQIVNWEDVRSWGYSASVDDWPDLFSQEASTATKSD